MIKRISLHKTSISPPRNHAKATVIIETSLTAFSGELGSRIEMYVLERSYIEEITENNTGVIELLSSCIFQ